MLDEATFDYFYGEGLIARPLRPIKSGKEARVVLCEGGSALGRPLVAIKEYAPIEQRTFRNDAAYHAGMTDGLKARDVRALRSKSRHGREVQEGLWLYREWEHLNAMHTAGCDVPEPIAIGPRSILMEFIGDEVAAAPQLQRVRLDARDARQALDAIMANVERMLSCNLVHGDLSAFNILWWNERPVIIDLPQGVDARLNPNADAMLTRDIENVCRHFQRYGVNADAEGLARGLWLGFMFAEL